MLYVCFLRLTNLIGHGDAFGGYRLWSILVPKRLITRHSGIVSQQGSYRLPLRPAPSRRSDNITKALCTHLSRCLRYLRDTDSVVIATFARFVCKLYVFLFLHDPTRLFVHVLALFPIFYSIAPIHFKKRRSLIDCFMRVFVNQFRKIDYVTSNDCGAGNVSFEQKWKQAWIVE